MLDMSVALTNPYTADTITVYRRQEVVNNFGESELSVTAYANVVAVVTASAPTTLDRRPDLQVSPKSIDVVTAFRLYSESESTAQAEYQPDIITWHGNNYIVKSLADFSSFGPGYVSASCAITDSQPTPTGNGA